MSPHRHLPADDFDGDGHLDARPPVPCARTSPEAEGKPRRLRSVRVIGEGRQEREELIVDCPRSDDWPSFAQCLRCDRFRGYSMRPAGEASFVSCAPDAAADAARPAPAHGADPSVRAVMSDPICVSSAATLDELAAIFVQHGISGLPVTDASGRPLGVVSKTDLVEAQAGRLAEKSHPSVLTVREVMTPAFFGIAETASIGDAAAIMADRRIHRVPVVARDGRVVGVVTALDVARWLGKNQPGHGL